MQPRTITCKIPSKVRTVRSLVPKQKRGYYTGEAAKKTKGGSCETFNIESVVFDDGQRVNNGMRLGNMVIYTSERIDGGVESYWEVDTNSLLLTTRQGRHGGD